MKKKELTEAKNNLRDELKAVYEIVIVQGQQLDRQFDGKRIKKLLDQTDE